MARVPVHLMLASLVLSAAAVDAKDAWVRAEEPAPPPAVANYLVGTRLGYITCSGKYRAYLEKLDLYELVSDDGIATPRRMDPPSNEEATACVHATVYKARGLQDAAARRATSPAAKTALREYTAAWEASLTSLEPGRPESPREFDARIRKQEARLDELQKRVEATAR